MQRNAAITIAFGTGDFSPAQTAGALDLDPFGTQTHGTAHALLHGTTESDPAFQLGSNVFSNQGGIHIRLFNLDDVDVQLAVGHFGQVFFQQFDVAALTADDDTRFSGVDVDPHLLFRSFDGNPRDTSLELFIFNEITNLDVFQQILLIVLVGEPFGIPIIDYAHSETMWINFLTHYSFPPSVRMIIFRKQPR